MAGTRTSVRAQNPAYRTCTYDDGCPAGVSVVRFHAYLGILGAVRTGLTMRPACRNGPFSAGRLSHALRAGGGFSSGGASGGKALCTRIWERRGSRPCRASSAWRNRLCCRGGETPAPKSVSRCAAVPGRRRIRSEKRRATVGLCESQHLVCRRMFFDLFFIYLQHPLAGCCQWHTI